MPLLDLTRQIKNTGNVVLEGVGYASGGSSGNAMNWIYDADMSGTQSNDFTASNTTRVQINATGHGLKDLWLDDEVIKIDLSGGSYNDFNASAGPFAVFDITDSAIILADTNDSVDNRGTTLPGGVTKVD
jgi:hypothetical protein